MSRDGPNLEAEHELLSALEGESAVTQMNLSKRLGVSIGLVNALIKRAARKGYVKIRTAPYKRYAYYLTPEGFSEKCRLVGEYLDHSLRFFRRARTEYLALFQRARGLGMRRLALVGAGELAEIAYLAAQEAEVDIVAVVDATCVKRRFCGAPVLADARELVGECDAFVITEQAAPQAAHDRLRAELPDLMVLAPALLKIATPEAASTLGEAAE